MSAPRSAFLIPLLLTLTLGAALGGCKQGGVDRADAKTNTLARAATPYTAIADGKADVEGGIIQVAARTAGIVSEVDVNEGDVVTKGQVLARQEDDAPRLAAETAAASLAQARAQTNLLEAQLAAAKREAARLEPLLALNSTSGQAVDLARDAVRNAAANLEAQQAAIFVAKTQLDQARYAEEETIIRAPVDGRIVRRYANPGTGASTLNVTPMFDLEPNGQRIVRAEVSESAQPFISVGQGVRLAPEADQSRTYPGKVLRIAPVFGARKLQSDDPAERTDDRVVEAVVSADGAPFLIGQRVLVKFVKTGG